MNITIHHQNTMIALRKEMGWPLSRPANDCIAFTSGRSLDVEVGLELSRIAAELGRDVIYSSWPHAQAKRPTGFSIAYRELLTVDVVDGLVPYAANDTVPVVLISVRNAETFCVDRRGSLTRLAGKPGDIAAGRRRAMQRIKSTAASLGDELLANNRWLAPRRRCRSGCACRRRSSLRLNQPRGGRPVTPAAISPKKSS